MNYLVQFKTVDYGWETLAQTVSYEVAEVLVQAYLGKKIDKNKLRIFNEESENLVYF